MIVNIFTTHIWFLYILLCYLGIRAHERSTLLNFSYSIQKGNTFAPAAWTGAFCLSVCRDANWEAESLSSCSRGLTPHTQRRSGVKVWLSLGSAKDNLYLQTATSSQIITLLWSLAVGFGSREQLYICVWYEGLVRATDQLITGHFPVYNEVSFKDFKFF